jgi:hypothetical protein
MPRDCDLLAQNPFYDNSLMLLYAQHAEEKKSENKNDVASTREDAGAAGVAASRIPSPERQV